MSTPIRFLHTLAHALSAIGLYREGHSARERALDEVYEIMLSLIEEHPKSTFTFLHDEVVFGDQPLRELGDWALAERLDSKEVQRIEFRQGASRQELTDFLVELVAILNSQIELQSVDPDAYEYIRFGPISMLGEEPETHTLFNLFEQTQMAEGLYEEAAKKGHISGALSRSVLDSLIGAMQSEGELVLPLIPHKPDEELITVRSMNTAVLSMALGEFMQLSDAEARLIGEVALLHDIGKVTIPVEILNKPGKLNPAEWEIMERHPVEGARILMRSGDEFDLAAVTAYEHHLSLDGKGYPKLHYPRQPHRVSQVISLCDAYDAMRTKRPYEDALPHDEILRILNERSGTKFASDLVEGFTTMLRQWRFRIVEAEGGEPLR